MTECSLMNIIDIVSFQVTVIETMLMENWENSKISSLTEFEVA